MPAAPPAAATPAPAEATPDISQDNGQAIAAGIGAVAQAISAIVGGIALAETQKLAAEMAILADPCIRMADLENRLVLADEGINKLISAAQFFATANQNSVIDAIDGWGENAGNAGGKAFPFWLFESGAIQHAPEVIGCAIAPPICLIAISAGLPSNGSDRPSSSNSGYQVGPGLYRHPGPTGTWRGTTFVDEWEVWKRHQQNNVWNPATGRPNWKARLVSWVGRSQPGWQTWYAGDEISSNSLIGRTIIEVENFRDLVAVARDRCAEATALAEELARDNNARLNEIVDQNRVNTGLAFDLAMAKTAAQTEVDKLETASDERQVTTIALAGVLGLALFALWGKK
jgi:hypothetical protein